MKLALIPPTSLLSYTTITDYQLLLPHVLEEDAVYEAHWRVQSHQPTHYRILDNGEAEGRNEKSPTELVQMAIKYNCHEVIATDVMGDAEKTKEASVRFLKDTRRLIYNKTDDLDVGIVAQGQTYEEVKQFIDDFLNPHGPINEKYNGLIGTIHLPRHLVTTIDRLARINLALWMNETYDLEANMISIHLLGANGAFPTELSSAKASAPFIRGMDTSMPFNYGYYGEGLVTGQECVRPDDYFDLQIDQFASLSMLHTNVHTMVGWAYGR